MTFSVQSLYSWYRQTIRNPKYRWWIILGTLAYLVMPFDFLPDFIPFVGQIDDVLLMTMLVSEVSQVLIERVKISKEKGSSQASNPTTKVSADATDVGNPVDVKSVSID